MDCNGISTSGAGSKPGLGRTVLLLQRHKSQVRQYLRGRFFLLPPSIFSLPRVFFFLLFFRSLFFLFPLSSFLLSRNDRPSSSRFLSLPPSFLLPPLREGAAGCGSLLRPPPRAPVLYSTLLPLLFTVRGTVVPRAPVLYSTLLPLLSRSGGLMGCVSLLSASADSWLCLARRLHFPGSAAPSRPTPPPTGGLEGSLALLSRPPLGGRGRHVDSDFLVFLLLPGYDISSIHRPAVPQDISLRSTSSSESLAPQLPSP